MALALEPLIKLAAALARQASADSARSAARRQEGFLRGAYRRVQHLDHVTAHSCPKRQPTQASSDTHSEHHERTPCPSLPVFVGPRASLVGVQLAFSAHLEPGPPSPDRRGG